VGEAAVDRLAQGSLARVVVLVHAEPVGGVGEAELRGADGVEEMLKMGPIVEVAAALGLPLPPLGRMSRATVAPACSSRPGMTWL
jgi:hypothetical protein